MKSHIKTIVFFLLLLIFQTATLPAANLDDLHFDAWLKLLHMRKDDLSGLWRSEVSNRDFFLSPIGHLDPIAEWQATLEAVTKPFIGPADSGPLCSFPARVSFINKITKRHLSTERCVLLNFWKKQINAKTVTLVHAAQYISNPASLFGHTFLRFDVQSKDRTDLLKLDTLAQSVGYFAHLPPDVSSYDYVIKGLSGGFVGRFNTTTYSHSLLEYNQMEDRDLWEYELDLTAVEVDQLLNHLWEMQKFGTFDYYFLLQNCGYQLLAFLEAGVPFLNLTRSRVIDKRMLTTNYFYLYLIPFETILRLKKEKIIRKANYRPALGTKMRKIFHSLSNQQRKLLLQLIANQVDAQTVEEPKVLEAAIAYMEYESNKTKGNVPSYFSELRKNILSQRAKLPVDASQSVITAAAEGSFGFARDDGPDIRDDNPDKSHGASKLSVGFLKQNNAGLSIGFRPALHRNIEGPGYPRGLSLEILDTQIALIPESKKIYFDHLYIFKAENLREFEALDHGLAWRFNLGWDHSIFRTGSSETDMFFSAVPAVGLATSPDDPVQGYALFFADLETPHFVANGTILGAGTELGTVAVIKHKLMGRAALAMEQVLHPSLYLRNKISWDLNYAVEKDFAVSAGFQATHKTIWLNIEMNQFF